MQASAILHWQLRVKSDYTSRAKCICTVQAGAIAPLVQLLKDDPGEIAAELAAVVLRNLASANTASRQAIVDADGLWPLLSLLAMGQEKLVFPMPCEVGHRGNSSACNCPT